MAACSWPLARGCSSAVLIDMRWSSALRDQKSIGPETPLSSTGARRREYRPRRSAFAGKHVNRQTRAAFLGVGGRACGAEAIPRDRVIELGLLERPLPDSRGLLLAAAN